MKVFDIINEEGGWLSKAWDTVMHGPGDAMEDYTKEAKKLLHRYGSQGTYKQLLKKFPKASPTDLKKAIRIVSTTRQDRS